MPKNRKNSQKIGEKGQKFVKQKQKIVKISRKIAEKLAKNSKNS